MQRKPKASLAFTRLNAARKVTFGRAVINAVTLNTLTFPALPVKVMDLTQSTDDLEAAILAAETGDKVAAENLQIVEAVWNNNLRLTANYVSNVADGNAATIALASFEPTKTETAIKPLPFNPDGLQANVNGKKGQLYASCDPMRDKDAFVFVASPEEAIISFNGDTMQVTVGTVTTYINVTTKRKTSFNNLPSGTKVDVSVYAVNSTGSGPIANGQHVIAQ